ncbi:MAG TPA: PIN domain-containing protein [Candidatus Hodarchaeales archaeon]|nr:PIN domain-containing protein [Candidatus Hodarchaeales archaeon]
MFIDSVAWIALKLRTDQWHKRAQELRSNILEAPRLFITDFIMAETYNFLLRKASSDLAFETLKMHLESEKITRLYNNDFSISGTKKILNRFSHLSLTDANIVWHSSVLGEPRVMSFDNGFDSVPNIQRIG